MNRRRVILGLLLLLVRTSGPAFAEAACPAGNLLPAARVQAQGMYGDVAAVTDGRLAAPGSPAVAPEAAVGEHDAWITFDLGRVTPVRAILLQAEGPAEYVLEGSADGSTWEWGWKAQRAEVEGLLVRHARSREEKRARYLRLRRLGNQGTFAVSELAVFCQVPEPWPPRMIHKTGEPSKDQGLLTRDRVLGIKALTALAGALLLLWQLLLERTGRGEEHRLLRDRALLVLGLLALLGWWNLLQFHFTGFQHRGDQFHYFLGAKYFRELGYDGLYGATTLADLEDGLQEQVLGRRVRNLRTNQIEGTQGILERADRIRNRFHPERWAEFRQDVRWFRQEVSPEYWRVLHRDHGFNATPVWTILGSLLTNRFRASDSSLLLLSLIDPALLLLLWFAAYRAFGWRATAVALLWWGTNFPGRYWWTGGSILRTDWLLMTVLGIAMVRRDRPWLGGLSLGVAALLRIFPGFVLVALVLKGVADWWSRGALRISRQQMRILAGVVVAVLVLVPLSMVSCGGFGVWTEFVRNSRLHLQTPADNLMGLRTVLSYDHQARGAVAGDLTSEDAYAGWRRARRHAFESRKPLFWLLLLSFLVLLGWASRNLHDWEALALGTGLISVVTELSCYYYAILLGLGLLVRPGRWAVGVLLCTLSAASVTASWHWTWRDELYTWISLGVVVTVVGIHLLIGREPSDTAAAPPRMAPSAPGRPTSGRRSPRSKRSSSRKRRR